MTGFLFLFCFSFLFERRRGLDLSLTQPLLLPCLYLPNQTSQFCFPSQLLFAQPEKSRWRRLRPHLQTLVCSHTQMRTNAHTFLHGFLPLPSLFSLIADKKPQTTTFLIKFLWALFCLTTPSLNEKPLVDFFDSFSAFREREKRRSLPKALRMSFLFVFCIC